MSENNDEIKQENTAAETAGAKKEEEKKIWFQKSAKSNMTVPTAAFWHEVLEWVVTLAVAFAIAFAIKFFVFDIVKVDGSSMVPTLHDGDRLIVTKLGYEPKQGDIIILDSTYKNRMEYFDNLAEDKGKDELSIVEKFFDGKTSPLPSSSMTYPLTVDENTVFVMGDNRNNSKDSRSSDLGLVPYDAILGKSQLRIWPLNAMGATK